MVMVTKMKTDGDKNEDRSKSLEMDFLNSNFSPGDEKANEKEAGVGLEVDQKENCEQNAKQKKHRNSGEEMHREVWREQAIPESWPCQKNFMPSQKTNRCAGMDQERQG